MASKNRRAIHFDLKESKLKEHYPKKDYKQAYRDISVFMKNNGFTHRQWSGYFSEKPLSFADLTDIMDKMWTEFPWLEKCATKFDVTNIGKTFDLLGMQTNLSSIEIPVKIIEVPNKQTVDALREAERIASDTSEKGYSDVEELLKDLNSK